MTAPASSATRWALLAAVVAVLLTPIAASAASSKPAPALSLSRAPGTQVEVRQGPAADPRRLRASALRTPGSSAASVSPTSTWQVTKSGFSPQQEAAFDAAVDIWATIVTSSVPITVDASFAALSPGVLGSAGPTWLYGGNGLGDGESGYPGALTNALLGYDYDTAEADITARFNSDPTNIYYGTDGNPPSGQIDFVSVVLHELGHGLGSVGGMTYSGGLGYKEPSPAIYDQFSADGAGASLFDSPSYPNGSTALGNALTGNALFWGGAQATAANGGVRPKLHAPNPWTPGSSYSHLDETTYGVGNINSLMTPQISAQEVMRTPGPIVAGMFRDMGWVAAVPATVPAAPTAVVGWPLDNGVHLRWLPAADNGASIDYYTVTPVVGGGPAVVTPTPATTIDITGLTNGTSYSFTVTAHNSVGDGAASVASAQVTPSAVDAVAPTTTITGKPAAITSATTAAFAFTADDHGWPGALSFTCSLDGSPAVPCTSGQSYTGLGNGLHTFNLNALDATLNSGPAQYTWRVDTVAPTVTAQPQLVWTLGTTMTLRYSGGDSGSGVASYAVRMRKAPYNGSFGAMSYPTTWTVRTATSTSQLVSRGYTTCMSVRSRDRAGNLSAWSPERCTAVPLDDRSLAASAGWTRATGSGYYAGTVSAARLTGASLTRSTVQARRITLLATTCASCGAVRVYWNGVLIRTVSLVTTTTRSKVLLTVADFGAVRSGTVVLRTTSTKGVYVDGLALSRA